MSEPVGDSRSYSYLGPAGTFTELALRQVEDARGQQWRPVSSIREALSDVVSGVSYAAMIAIENSVDGGVTVAQDALANIRGLHIIGEYLVPVGFMLVARRGTKIQDVRTVAAHPVAYGQCRGQLEQLVPAHQHLPAGSNVQAVVDLLASGSGIDAAIAPPGIDALFEVEVLAEGVADNPDAVTRFVLVSKCAPVGERTGADKTSVIVELPEDRPGALLDLLDQFASRGVNLTLLASRPIGDRLGRYRFVIDAEGHIRDERVANALMGVKRHSPRVVFLGSYPRADQVAAQTMGEHEDERFREARDWLLGIISGAAG